MNTAVSSLRRRLLLGTLAFAAIGSCPQKALAQSFGWNTAAGGSWITDTNWTPVVAGDWPKDAGDIANLTFNITAAAPITLDAAITVGALTIGDTNASHAYTLSDGAGGSLTFDNLGSTATLMELATGLSDTVTATLRTAGDLDIVNLNTTASRTFTISGPLTSSAVAGTQTVTFSQTNTNAAVLMSGSITNGLTGGTIALTKTGSGTLTLGAVNGYTGGTTLSGGTIAGNAANSITGTITQNAASTLRINNYALASSPALVDTATGAIVNASAGTFSMQSNAVAANAVLVSLGALNVSGNYAIRSDNNGTALATATIFTLDAPLNISGTPTITSSSGTNATVTIGGLTTLNSDVTISPTTTFRLTTVAEDATPRKITKAGSGLLVMLGAANYTGGTDIINGPMQFSVTGASGSALIQLGDVSGTSAAEVRAAGGVTVANDITVRSGSSGTMKIARDTSATAGTATYSGLITLQKATTFEDVSTAGAGTAPMEITGKITGADVKITTNARTGSTNQLIRFLNAANDFGFAAATPDAITHNGGVLLVQADAALGAAGNGITLINTNGSLRADGTFSTARTITSSVAAGSAAGIDVTAGNELTLTAAGQLQGVGGLNKTGNTGILIITGDNNARTTGTTITTGTIRIGSSANIGNTSPVTLSGGTWDLRNNASTVFTNNLTVTASSTINVDQAVGGAGAGNTHTIGTIAIGANTLTTTNSAGANSYGLITGAVTASGGATFTNNIGGTGTLTIPSIAYNSGAAGTVTLRGTGTTTVTNGLTTLGLGALAVTKNDAGTVTIGAASNYTGLTTITAGTLRATAATSLGTGASIALGAATLALANDVSTNYPYNVTITGTAFINVDRAPGGVGTGNKHTIGTLTVPTQVLTFTGGNDYSLDTGIVSAADNATLTSNLTGTGVVTIPSIVANNIATKTLTLRGTGNMVVSGAITQANTGVYSLLKLDAGTVTLNGATTITGNVNIGNGSTNGGTLKLGVAGAIPNNTLTVLSGTLDMNGIALNPTSVVMGGGPTLTSANINTNGATLTLGGNVTYSTGTAGFLGAFINGAVSLGGVTRVFTTGDTAAADPDLTINGAISDATGGFTKAGGGQLALTGTTANTWAGPTTISNGSIQLGKTAGVNAVPGDVSITPSGGSFHSVLKWLASNQVPDSAIITMTGTSGVGGGNMDLNGFDETIAGLVWNNNQGTGSQVIRTGAGTLTVNSDITIAGTSAATTTSVPFGAAYVGNLIDGNLNLGGAVRTFDITATGNAVVSAAISNGGILKAGPSRLTLSGATANTFAGDVTVSAGTLLLAKPAGVTAIIGNVFVNGGSVIYQNQANDQIADTASVTLDSGSFAFSPGTGNGNASETLTNFTMNGGIFRTAVGVPAGAHGHVVVTGTFTLETGDFAVNSYGSLSANKFILNGGTNVVGGNSIVEVNTLAIGAGGLEATGGQMKMNLSTTAAALGSRIVLGGNVTSFASFLEAGIYGESAAGTLGTRTVEIGAGLRTFNIADGDALNDFRVDFDITGAGTLVKEGDGTLAINGLIGTGTTSLTANDGVVTIAQSQTLAALTIGTGATVILNEDLLPAPAAAGGGPLDDFGAPIESFAPAGFEEPAGVAAVPEPGSIGLLLAGALGFGVRRRRG